MGLDWIGLRGSDLVGLDRIGLALSSKPSLASVAFFSGFGGGTIN